jgi:plastocyanin
MSGNGTATTSDRLLANVERVVLGKHEEISLVLAALAAEGHVLLEDVPGTAKTILARSIAQTIEGATFARIQSGQITFVINNKGNEVHNFAILGNKAGAQIAPGTSETWTVSLPPGTYNYQCDVPFHAERGMVGQFTVTP